jgi:hypothetical protein
LVIEIIICGFEVITPYLTESYNRFPRRRLSEGDTSMNYSLIINVDDEFSPYVNNIVDPHNLFATNDTDCPAIFHELTTDANDDPSLATTPEDEDDYFLDCTPNQRVEDLVN